MSCNSFIIDIFSSFLGVVVSPKKKLKLETAPLHRVGTKCSFLSLLARTTVFANMPQLASVLVSINQVANCFAGVSIHMVLFGCVAKQEAF